MASAGNLNRQFKRQICILTPNETLEHDIYKTRAYFAHYICPFR